MAIGLEAKGYKESEMRAGKRHRNRQKVAKRDERAQELSHKAAKTRLFLTIHPRYVWGGGVPRVWGARPNPSIPD
jgi:hypothetical protein